MQGQVCVKIWIHPLYEDSLEVPNVEMSNKFPHENYKNKHDYKHKTVLWLKQTWIKPKRMQEKPWW